jgi:hypothetical protein
MGVLEKGLVRLMKGSCSSGQIRVDSEGGKGDGCKLVLRHDT